MPVTSEYTPAGLAMSAAVIISDKDQQRTTMARSLQILDRVHGDGALASIRMNTLMLDNGTEGMLCVERGLPTSIYLSPSASCPEFTIAHEVGHWLDIAAMPSSGILASRDNDHPLNGFIRAAAHTRSMRDLREFSRVSGDRHIQEHIDDYLMLPEELWARAYAQYVAVRSADAKLLQGLTLVNREPINGHWPREEFLQLANLIDKLFLKLGWITS